MDLSVTIGTLTIYPAHQLKNHSVISDDRPNFSDALTTVTLFLLFFLHNDPPQSIRNAGSYPDKVISRDHLLRSFHRLQIQNSCLGIPDTLYGQMFVPTYICFLNISLQILIGILGILIPLPPGFLVLTLYLTRIRITFINTLSSVLNTASLVIRFLPNIV